MSLLVTFNGQNYIIPTTGEINWGSNLDDYLVAIAAGSFQKTGGSFTLSSEADFGGSFGLKSLYYKSRSTNPASSGILRLANADQINWRNNANTLDLPLTVNSSDQLIYNGSIIALVSAPNTFTSLTLSDTSNQLHLGTTNTITLTAPSPAASRTYTIPDVLTNASFVLTEGNQTVNGTKTFSDIIVSTNAEPLSANVSTNGEVYIQLQNGNVGSAAETSLHLYNGTDTGSDSTIKMLVGSGPTYWTIGIDNSDSDKFKISQANSLGTNDYLAITTAGLVSINSLNISGLTASTALISDASKNITSSSTTSTELAGLHSLTASKALVTNASGIVTTSATTATELGYVSGVTSAIQTQLTAKLPLAGGIMTGPLLLDLGTDALPSLAFTTNSGNTDGNKYGISSNTNLGLTNGVNIDVNGVLNTSFQASEIRVAAGVQIHNLSTTNQLVLGNTGKTTITAPAAAADRVYTIPDAGTNSSFMLLDGNQTINGTQTFAGQLIGKGTATNDSAAAGNIGQYVESVVANISAGTTAQFFDLTSISLTAGDWDVSVLAILLANGATFTSLDYEVGFSTTSGNSSTGLAAGDNEYLTVSTAFATGSYISAVIPPKRVSLASTTTYYLKVYTAVYTAGTPKLYGRISARRVR
jgi:hypothetical protein